MKTELLEELYRYLATVRKVDAAKLVQDLRTNGLRVQAEQDADTGTVSVEVASLGRVVEAIAALSREAPSLPKPRAQDRVDPLLDKIVHRALTESSRHAQVVVGDLLQNEPDPHRQWQRVVALMHEVGSQASANIDVDLSDNSFLYSR